MWNRNLMWSSMASWELKSKWRGRNVNVWKFYSRFVLRLPSSPRLEFTATLTFLCKILFVGDFSLSWPAASCTSGWLRSCRKVAENNSRKPPELGGPCRGGGRPKAHQHTHTLPHYHIFPPACAGDDTATFMLIPSVDMMLLSEEAPGEALHSSWWGACRNVCVG